MSRADERGRKEFLTEKAWEELEEVMKEGRIATYAQARDFLSERGVEYASADRVGGLFRRRRVKLKTGRPRHEKADTEENRRLSKKFAEKVAILGEASDERESSERTNKPLKVLAFDEARSLD